MSPAGDGGTSAGRAALGSGAGGGVVCGGVSVGNGPKRPGPNRCILIALTPSKALAKSLSCVQPQHPTSGSAVVFDAMAPQRLPLDRLLSPQ